MSVLVSDDVPRDSLFWKKNRHLQGACTGMKLIPDSPASADAFGSHQRLAQLVADLLTEEHGGRAVGLAGPYGVGKSTVINLMTQILAEEEGFLVWVFDAWAHEGDHLRRTFLESLTKSLLAADLVPAKKWKRELAKLAGRYRVQRTKTTPRLSALGWQFAAVSLLVPIGLVLLNSGVDAGVSFTPGQPNWPFSLGLLLSLSPALLALYTWLRAFRTETETDWAEVFAVFGKQDVTHREMHSIETPRPSSLEFERFFSQLMSDALSGADSETQKLVLAIDNLDRVDAERALEVWSTLQTFLGHSRRADPIWLRKLWVLVPFDPKAFRELWTADTDDGSNKAEAFIDKSFAIVFWVPRPILSDWSDYLRAHLRDVFSGEREELLHDCYRVFRLWREPMEEPPTPRDLIVFVNQTQATAEASLSNVPLPQVAYYVLLKREEKDVVGLLRSGSIPEAEIAPVLGPEAREGLAALAFGVPKEIARQLLLEEPLKQALLQGDRSALAELRRLGPTIWPVAEDVIRRISAEWPAEEANALMRAIVVGNDTGVLDLGGEAARNSSFRRLAWAVGRIERWDTLDEEVAEGVEVLLENVPDGDLARSLRSSFQNYLEAEDEKEEASSEGHPAVTCLRLLRVAGALNLDANVRDGFRIPGDLSHYTNALLAIINAGGEDLAEFFHASLSESEFVTQLAATVSGGKYGKAHFTAVKVSYPAMPEAAWTQLMNTVRDRLLTNQSATVSEVLPLLRTLWYLADATENLGPLVQLVRQGHLLHHIHIAKQKNNWRAIAECVYAILRHDPELTHQETANVGAAAQGRKVLEELMSSPPPEFIEAMGELLTLRSSVVDTLNLLDTNEEWTSLAGAVFRWALAKRRSWASLRAEVILEHWQHMGGWLAPKELLSRLEIREQLREKVFEGPFVREQASLYAALVSTADNGEELSDWWVEGLKTLSRDDWEAVLEEEGAEIQLLRALVQRGESGFLGAEFREALSTYGERLALGSVEGIAEPERLKGIGRALRSDYRGILWDELWETLRRRRGKAADAFFDALGSELVESDRLRNENVGITRVIIPMIEGHVAGGIRWLRETLEVDPGFVGDASQPYRQVLKEKLEKVGDELEKEHEGEARARLREDLVRIKQLVYE